MDTSPVSRQEGPPSPKRPRADNQHEAEQSLISNLKPPSLAPSVTSNFINNRFVVSKARSWIPVYDPKLLTCVPESSIAEVQDAIASASLAQKEWRRLPTSKRRSYLYRLVELMRLNQSELVLAVCCECGKTTEDAEWEISRSINMLEAAISISSTVLGFRFLNEKTETLTINEPLGVCAAITSFCFPLMIPMWFIPFAIATGNTIVLKPSEKVPLAIMRLAHLFVQAGLPPGVFNIVHGGSAVADRLLADPVIKAISFVGSDEAGQHIHDTARSAFGSAGQRCMGLSVALFVGTAIDWLPDLVGIAQRLVVGSWSQPNVDIGPLISRAAKIRVENAIQSAIDDGATVSLDGRNIEVPNFPDGNFIGPTIISNVQNYMSCYQDEIFGPVLLCRHVNTLEEAIELINDNIYGNGCSIFTTNLANAQRFQQDVNVGRLGINVPVLDINAHGHKGYQFLTWTKTVSSSIWQDDVGA
ncbi:methylmalonate-semialdehyde dehydrogenase [Aspergillus karnatakaensis]|uniref:methylmalonate-semialdehyde dehydrogenase n=1 Tax=Aspergillus karnatakaensis TaxID=1810916 RepID=UPI003CCDFB63